MFMQKLNITNIKLTSKELYNFFYNFKVENLILKWGTNEKGVQEKGRERTSYLCWKHRQW